MESSTGLMARIIPCLDVKDGRVVKGVRFQNLRDLGEPDELADKYQREGADELVLLDISATLESRKNNKEVICSVRNRLSIPLTVGGGVASAEDVKRLLDAGADKVAINSAAVLKPAIITEMAERFGRQCTVVAIDAKASGANNWSVVIRSGETPLKLDVVEWAVEAARLGAGEILLTSWDKDGTRSGYELKLLRAVSSAVNIPVIASGGANRPADLLEALQAGADAVLAASIFHEGEYSCDEIKRILSESGMRFRI